MNKKWLSILLVLALSLTMAGTAFAAWGGGSYGGGGGSSLLTTATGTVTAVDVANSKLTVKDANGVVTTYTVASTVTINILNNPTNVTLDKVLVGDTVVLTLYNKVLRDIDVTARA